MEVRCQIWEVLNWLEHRSGNKATSLQMICSLGQHVRSVTFYGAPLYSHSMDDFCTGEEGLDSRRVTLKIVVAQRSQ